VRVVDDLRSAWGIARSLAIYYGKPWRYREVEYFYRRFIGPGDLAFDAGAHVGSRIRAWRGLGARVVAIEPQPQLSALLRLLYGRDPRVSLEQAAVGRACGEIELHLNLPNPTIASASQAFMAAAADAPAFVGQAWTKAVSVPMTTLDALISRHGVPRFIKIDVEGFEAEAMAGLSHPVAALSLEFVPMAAGIAEQALDRLRQLGEYHFNASFGDSMRFVHPRPLGHDHIRQWLRGLGDDGPAGDIYAAQDPRLLMS
jgi:FkbM family methyltransferase